MRTHTIGYIASDKENSHQGTCQVLEATLFEFHDMLEELSLENKDRDFAIAIREYLEKHPLPTPENLREKIEPVLPHINGPAKTAIEDLLDLSVAQASELAYLKVHLDD